MKLPISKATVLSTTHISERDAGLLRSVEGRNNLTQLPRVEKHGYGWCVFVSADRESYKETAKALENYGFSPAFQRLYRLAFQQKIHILDLDQDGEEVKDLEIFDW